MGERKSERKRGNEVEDYWQYSGGVTVAEARAIAETYGFPLEIGRISRFDNARGVVVGRADLQDGLVNKLLLAEEIQHGLDRATSEASRAVRRGLNAEEFHAEVFQRILQGSEQGRFSFLTVDDVRALRALIQRLGSRRG